MTIIIRPGSNHDAFDDYLAGRLSVEMPALINPKYKEEWNKWLTELNGIHTRYQEMLEHKLNKTLCENLIEGMLLGLSHGGMRPLIYLAKLESKPDFLLADE